MSQMIYIEIEKRASKLQDYYREEFKSLYGDYPPTPEYEDQTTLKWLAQEYKEDMKCERLIKTYLSWDDEWTRKSGYALRFLKKAIPALIILASKDKSFERELFKVGETDNNIPVLSPNQNILRSTGFVPKTHKNKREEGTILDEPPNPELAQLCTQIISDCASGNMTKEQHKEAMILVDDIVNRVNIKHRMYK